MHRFWFSFYWPVQGFFFSESHGSWWELGPIIHSSRSPECLQEHSRVCSLSQCDHGRCNGLVCCWLYLQTLWALLFTHLSLSSWLKYLTLLPLQSGQSLPPDFLGVDLSVNSKLICQVGRFEQLVMFYRQLPLFGKAFVLQLLTSKPSWCNRMGYSCDWFSDRNSAMTLEVHL